MIVDRVPAFGEVSRELRSNEGVSLVERLKRVTSCATSVSGRRAISSSRERDVESSMTHDDFHTNRSIGTNDAK